MQHRRGPARAPTHRPSEHVADGAWQVASWDITYLKSHVRGAFFYLYLVVDVWSRKILGWEVHDVESAELSSALLQRIRDEAGPDVDLVGWVLHADNGGPMKGATMLATMQRADATDETRPVAWVSLERAQRFCESIDASLPTTEAWSKASDGSWGLDPSASGTVGPLREWTSTLEDGLAIVRGGHAKMKRSERTAAATEPLFKSTEMVGGSGAKPETIAGATIGFRCAR